jgi:hypothetical protein
MAILGLSDREIKTQAYAAAITALTGKYPEIIRTDETNYIELYPDQVEKAQEYLISMIEAEPSDVQINVKPVIVPVVLKKYWPWLVGIPSGIVLLSFILGRIGKRR